MKGFARLSDPTFLQVLLRKMRSARTRLRSIVVSQRFGFDPSTVYNDDFYDDEGCVQSRDSSAAVAKIINDRLSPKTVFDFGCGEGGLIHAFSEMGVEASGCEGSSHGVRRCPPSSFVFQQDLKQPVLLNRQVDLAICIEVAEHLPARYATTLVSSMAAAAAAAKHIVFSASGPGEPGDDHINLQLPAYWVDLFEQRGCIYREAKTVELRTAFLEAGAPRWLQYAIVLEKSKG